MKYITFAVPCYNSQDYLDRCVRSLLVGGEDVEIILVNDGSTDRTGEIIDGYAEKYPQIVRAVHKENGGHGSGVNKGLELATGLYYKVVDSDDWLEKEAYEKLLHTIKKHVQDGEESIPDLYIVNYVYNHLDEGVSRSVGYKNIFPEEKLCSWQDINDFKMSQYIIKHALVYRTEILRESGVKLPEHTFFVDNIIAYQPLPYVESIYYINADLYQYYIGREDQSVNEKMLMKRIDQYIDVVNIMADCVDLEQVSRRKPKLAVYMTHFLSILMMTVIVHLMLIGDDEAKQKAKLLWAGMKERHPALYRKLRYTKLSGLTRMPFRRIVIAIYRIVRKIYKFQ